MFAIQEAIVVEGRYDKNVLSQVVDTVIIETGGFGVFKNEELKALLRRLAQTRGIILLTDSDGAGFVIRNHLKGCLSQGIVKQAYIPDIQGKEKRKSKGGKEGKLGVEGMPPQVLETALRRCGATFLEGEERSSPKKDPITKADLVLVGLSGRADAKQRRESLLNTLELPQHMTTNALLPVLNALYERETFLEEVETWI